MTKEELIKNQFPNDEFLQSGVSQIVDKCIAELEKENAELKEKFLTVKKDDIRKAKLNECKTYEEKVEYLRQVTNYALFNDDISVMLWCFCQRGEIDTEQLIKAKDILQRLMENQPRSKQRSRAILKR